MPKYDASAALEVLGVFAEQKNPSASGNAKIEAARELLAELAALDGKMVDLAAGFDPRFRGPTVAVSLSFAGARVTYSAGQDKFFAFIGDEVKVSVPLRFNRARGVFEGEELDTSRMPVPGGPDKMQRDALVVLAEAVVEAMKKDQ